MYVRTLTYIAVILSNARWIYHLVILFLLYNNLQTVFYTPCHIWSLKWSFLDELNKNSYFTSLNEKTEQQKIKWVYPGNSMANDAARTKANICRPLIQWGFFNHYLIFIFIIHAMLWFLIFYCSSHMSSWLSPLYWNSEMLFVQAHN